jgi:transposase
VHLYKKIKKGIDYFYLRETKRVDGKVVCSFQQYIGTKDKLNRVILNGFTPVEKILTPQHSEVLSYGAVAAFLSVFNKIGAPEVIDRVCTKRDQDLPVSSYLLSAAINRAIDSKSKSALASWMRSTSLPYLLSGFDPQKYSSQNFWNHMHRMSDAMIHQMEDQIAKNVVEIYKLNLDTLLFDGTNYYSYIHSFNASTTIEKRGHNKQKRMDLRQCNFSLLVTKDEHIPLYHRVYDGNTNDPTSFRETVFDLKGRVNHINGADSKQITIVFDSGNVCDQNIRLLDQNGLLFVSKLKPSNYPELLDIELSHYQVLKELDGVQFYQTTREVYGTNRLIVIKFSKQHYNAERITIMNHVQETKKELLALQSRLQSYQGRNQLPSNVTEKTVQNNILKILKRRTYLKKLFDLKLEIDGKFPLLKWELSDSNLEAYFKKYLGKTVYFSSSMELTPAQVIQTYNFQSKIEQLFKISKDRRGGCWWPKFHWTDQNIKVHAFYCYLSLLGLSLMELEVSKNIKNKKYIHNLVGHLSRIYEIRDTYKNQNKKTTTLIRHNKLSDFQSQLFGYFKLGSYFNDSKT